MPNTEISVEELEKLRRLAAQAEAQDSSGEDKDQLQAEVAAKLQNLSARVDANEAAARAALAGPNYGSGWGRQIHKEFDIDDLPSGTRCRAKQLSIEDAMALGLLESLDMFTSALMNPIIEGEPTQDEQNGAMLKNLKDPEKRASFFGTVNRIVVHTVVVPKVVGQTNEDGSVNEGEVFVGDIPFQDKMHIFRHVFGSAGEAIAPFREGSQDGVADVDEVPGV